MANEQRLPPGATVRLISALPQTTAHRTGDLISAAAAASNEEWSELDDGFRQKAAAIEAKIVVDLGETERRQAFRDEGATSTEAWVVERYGVATSTARALTHGGEKAWDLPHLIGAVCAGDISFDKMRAVADVATPETDEGLKEQAQRCTVRELADVARTMAQVAASHAPRPLAPIRNVAFSASTTSSAR